MNNHITKIINTTNNSRNVTRDDEWLDMFSELLVRECIERIRAQYIPARDSMAQERSDFDKGVVRCGVRSVIALEALYAERTEKWYQENILDKG